MTRQKAETVANVLIGLGAAGAAFYVLRTPAMRRRALQMLRGAALASGPWLVAETRAAWAASGAPPGGAPASSPVRRPAV